jgi:rfaE bifunctional protein kinase chain/domain
MPNIKELKYIKTQSPRKKVVFVSGNFNIIHPGHLRLLRFAKECGDYLVVGVLDDKAPGSFIDEKLRLESLQAIAWVDYAFILRETPAAFIEKLQPAFVVKGKEHEERENPEKDILHQYGGKLLFSSGEISFSSIDLMNAEWKELSVSSIKKPADYPKRHKFSFSELTEISDKMKGLKVCVLGDTIVDEYITCDALGMSQEDPTIVVTPVAREKFMGGAGIVALHARGLGADVQFFSVVGKDEIQNYAQKQLESQGVHVHLFQDESRPTTLKQRFRAKQKTLLRVSHLRQHSISAEIRELFYKEISDVLAGIDLVIFSDFNYGCLPQTLVDQVTTICDQRGIMMVADSQSSSQVGDVSRFKNMTLVTPTEREARFAVHDFESGLIVLAEKLRKKSFSKNVIMTLAEEGILIHAETDAENAWLTDKLPAFNTAPKDVSGAGDSFLACTAMAMAVGTDIWKSAYLGSLAAACQIGRTGNIPLTSGDLKMELNCNNVI